MVDVGKFVRQSTARAGGRGVHIPTGFSSTFQTLNDLGNQIADKAVATEQFNKGIEAQENNEGTLQERSGFLGFDGLSTEAFNKGARLQFTIQKEQQLASKINELELQALENPNEFDSQRVETEFAKFADKFLQDVPTELRPTFNQNVAQAQASLINKVQREEIQFEREKQFATVNESISNTTDLITRIVQTEGVTPDDPEVQAELENLIVAREAELQRAVEARLVTPDKARQVREEWELDALIYDIFAGYKQARNKEAYIKAIDDDDGPLADQDQLTREAVQATITKWTKEDRVVTATQKRAARQAEANAKAIALRTGEIDEGAIRTVENTLGSEAAQFLREDLNLLAGSKRQSDALLSLTQSQARTWLEDNKPDASDPQFAQKIEIWDNLVAARAKFDELLFDDPAQAVINQFPRLQSPAEMIEAQRQLGVTDGRIRILPKSIAERTVAEINAAGDPQLSATYIDQLRQQYTNEQFNKYVMPQLLDAGLEEDIEIISSAQSPSERQDLSGALSDFENNKKTATAIVGSGSLLKAEVDEEIRKELEPFRKTMVGPNGELATSSRQNAFNKMKRAILADAYQNIAEKGMDASTAVETAVEKVNRNYTIYDSFRVPNDVEGHTEADLALEFFKDRRLPDLNITSLPEDDPRFADDAVQQGFESLTPEQVEREYRNFIRNEGFWVTNGSETGVFLVDGFGNAVWFVDENGNQQRVEIPFSSLTGLLRERRRNIDTRQERQLERGRQDRERIQRLEESEFLFPNRDN